MNLTLDLTPDIEAQLRRMLAHQDTAGARDLLAEALGPVVEALLVQDAPEAGSGTSSADFQAKLDRLVAEAGTNLPPLSDAAVSREGIYGEHP